MATSSISSPRTWKWKVFTSFHGPDVRKKFLTHLRKQFASNGISMFDDERIKRSQTINTALTEAIRGSRISIVLLTKRYASSSWCLDELLEILECRKEIDQIVMTIFYGVHPSDVADQTGKFGIAFNKMCAKKTKKEKHKWSQALKDVASIAGFDFKNCDNEAKMIEKIAQDVLDKLNATPSTYFVGMVGLEAHLSKMESLLDLDNDEVKMVGIIGPAGIGKTTIARALQSRISNRFQLTCFVDNLRESCHSGSNEYGSKLRLQEQLISNILNHNMTIRHLDAVKVNLCDQKVLIILDDVSNLNQLKALANETTWFGPGSRIVVTTKDKQILQNHGIDIVYYVGFPSDEQALKILCGYAFKQSYPHNGFEKLAERVIELCGKLPLGLSVVGSSLCGKNGEWWEGVINRLNTSLDPAIEQVLRVGFESLQEKEQSLFLHIAIFFNHKSSDLLKDMLAIGKREEIDIEYGLEILVDRCLINKTTNEEIVMQKLLQRVATKFVREEPWKHRFLIDASTISHALEHAEDAIPVSGISYDISDIAAVSIRKGAFERMRYLRFLKVYKRTADGNDVLHIPEELELPRLLRLLDWEAYPSKRLPPKFQLDCLVELNLQDSKLEYLWEGTKVLTKLKKMNLSRSYNLKELPDLSSCPNLVELNLSLCDSLVQLPSSMGNLHKLELLEADYCESLQFVPIFKLASLLTVDMFGCWKLRKFPHISEKIRSLTIVDTMLEEAPDSLTHWSGLIALKIYGRVDPFQNSEEYFPGLGGEDIEKIPEWIKGLQGLKELHIIGCPELASLTEFPVSLRVLRVNTCESLETVSFPSGSQTRVLLFFNSLNLSPEAKREITDHSWWACLPGKTMPGDMVHRARGNSLTIRSDFSKFRIFVMVSPKQKMTIFCPKLLCRIRINGCCIEEDTGHKISIIHTEHLFMSCLDLLYQDGWCEQDNEIVFEFSTTSHEVDIVECGVKILRDEIYARIMSEEDYESGSEQINFW